MMNYKDYHASIEYDDEAEIFHGEVLNTRDVITFQGKSVKELRKAFQDSVDDYLDWCAQRGKKPEKPYSGKLLLRLDPDLHRKIALLASQSGKSLNNYVLDQLR